MKTRDDYITTMTEQLLSKKGPLQRLLPDYTERTEQIAMARMICEAFYNDKIATIQAGTGVGKSFAYLIPAILWATHEGEPVIISTATTNLQDQLSQKDLPLLHNVFDFEFDAVVVKGAQQYICLDRLDNQSALLPFILNHSEQRQLAAIQQWAPISPTGQRSELDFEPTPRLWREVEVSTTLCLYDKCRHFEECAFIRDRRRIPRAHIIITNHSLLTSDLVLRTQSDGYASVLPEYTRLVIDEAHKFEAAVTEALSVTVNPVMTNLLLSKLHNPSNGEGFLSRISGLSRHLPTGKGERVAFSKAVARCEGIVASAIQALQFFFERIQPLAYSIITPSDTYVTRLSYTNDWLRSYPVVEIRENELENLTSLLDRLAQDLYGIQSRISRIEETENVLRTKKEIQFYREQVSQLRQALDTLFSDEDDDIRWIEIPPSQDVLSFRGAPLGVDHFLGPFLFEQVKSIIFTSATLAPGKSFDFFHSSISLDTFERHRQVTAILDSPFPYETNSLLLVPTDVPEPTSPRFQEAINAIIPSAIEASRGRALVLFTSHEMLRATYEATRGRIEMMGYECMAQGQHSRSVALNRFRDETSSVLFGTTSFWEGIDVVGDSLSLVIIVRLPFSVPNDPIVEARSHHLKEEGKNPFWDFQLPVAAMRLQQGFGRLIRTHTDRGVVLCLDRRLVTKQYAEYILRSLPPTPVVKLNSEECISRIRYFLESE